MPQRDHHGRIKHTKIAGFATNRLAELFAAELVTAIIQKFGSLTGGAAA